MRGPGLDLKAAILGRMTQKAPFGVWTPRDFLDLGSREAVDQALHRLNHGGDIRRIARGLYDKPRANSLTGQPTARIVVHTDARLKPIALGKLQIEFKTTAPSKLYWAGRPAMRVVQALHWLHDIAADQDPEVEKRLLTIFADPDHGASIVNDLQRDLLALPAWMQVILRDLLSKIDLAEPPPTRSK